MTEKNEQEPIKETDNPIAKAKLDSSEKEEQGDIQGVFEFDLSGVDDFMEARAKDAELSEKAAENDAIDETSSETHQQLEHNHGRKQAG